MPDLDSWPPIPTVIGHRGASALRPEHTLASYALAIEAGADFIEPDLVPTKDGVLVARHENAIAQVDEATGAVIEATTDVAERAEFARRRATKQIDGKTLCGWFTEDFTLAELKTLRAKERIPLVRPANTRFDGQFEIATWQEIVELAKTMSAQLGRTVGVYAETKHPAYFRSIGLALESRLLAVLATQGWNDAAAPVFLQSFEPTSLLRMRAESSVRMVQLIEALGKPGDAADPALPDALATHADMITPAGLAEIARYAQGIGPHKALLLPVAGDGHAAATSLAADAHAAGLLVHVWTVRPENAFLPAALRGEPVADRSAHGDTIAEMHALLQAGADGL
ncbi:MAG: glycerophosphodiester phosphodiesterase family protein, partial [Burkholderiaceae bacterium]